MLLFHSRNGKTSLAVVLAFVAQACLLVHAVQSVCCTSVPRETYATVLSKTKQSLTASSCGAGLA